MISKILAFALSCLICLISEVNADIVYLKNGRNIEGLIKNEDGQSVELDVGFGTLKFYRQEIKSIYKSTPEEIVIIRKKWQRQQKEAERERLIAERQLQRLVRERRLREEKDPDSKPKEVEFSQESQHIMIDTLLNKKVKASLLLDTGASDILLSSRIAKELGVRTDTENVRKGEVVMADGSQVEAIYIVLDSVDVQGAEARDIRAVVLLEDAKMEPQDGLLGMSFLSKFNFQIDTVNKKLILEKPN